MESKFLDLTNVDSGILPINPDQYRKTGKRNGLLGHNGGMDQVLKDIQQAESKIKMAGIPHFIMGHSMGGGLALKYASTGPKDLMGVIASAPLVI
jgi:acylglycerol lipase